MERFFLDALLIYTLTSCGLLLVAVFRIRSQPNRYLLIGFGTICAHLVYKLMWVGLANHGQYEIPVPFGMVYPVLLYLFAQSHYLPERSVSFWQISLLSSPLLVHLALFAIVCLQPAASGWMQGYSKAYYVSCMLSLLAYGMLTVRLYSGSKTPATSTDILIRQLTMLCFGLVVLTYAVLYETSVVKSEIGFEVRPVVYLFLAIGFALIVRYIIANDIRIFQEVSEAAPLALRTTHEPDGAPLALQPPPEPELAQTIERELNRTKLYLNPSVSLDMLAQQTAIPRHHLTRVFRTHYKKSFYQYIAGTRIEYAISRLLEKGDTVTLESLSYECGFNSKTSFNRYFKAYTGMNPSEYRYARQSICGQAARCIG